MKLQSLQDKIVSNNKRKEFESLIKEKFIEVERENGFIFEQ